MEGKRGIWPILCESRQERFFENYLTSQREHIFSNVEVLLYVFDVVSEQFEVSLESSFALAHRLE